MCKESFYCFLMAVGFIVMNFLFPHSGLNYVAAFFLLSSCIIILYSTLALLEFIWSPKWEYLWHKMRKRELRKKPVLKFKKLPR